jgi:hypothetical protein
MRRALILLGGVVFLSIASLLFAAPAPVAPAKPELLTVGKNYTFTIAGHTNPLSGVVVEKRSDEWVKFRVPAGFNKEKVVWVNLRQVSVIEPEE